jgi:sporulation protein YlmC with PRC-barrel domain
MRYKDISSKEIVDVNQGARLGVLGQTDLEIDEKT